MSWFSFNDVLRRIQDRNPQLKKKLEEASIVQSWDEIVGTPMNKHCRAIRVEEGKLIVETDHPAWAQQIQLHGVTLTKRILEKTGVALQGVITITKGQQDRRENAYLRTKNKNHPV